MELEGIRTAGITAVPGNYREFRFLRGVREVIRFLDEAGAVLGVVIGRLVPMAAWVALGPWLGFVRGPFRLRKPLLL